MDSFSNSTARHRNKGKKQTTDNINRQKAEKNAIFFTYPC
jgi:hypothetical protein